MILCNICALRDKSANIYEYVRNIYSWLKSEIKNTSFCAAPEGFTFMSKPEGDAHSKSSIITVAACMATMPTNIHEAVSNGSKNRV